MNTNILFRTGSRLKEYRLKKGLKSKDMALKAGIAQGAYSGLETNKSIPSGDTLRNLILNTDINLYWLLTGEGQMERPDPKGERMDQIIRKDQKLFDIVQILRMDQETKDAVYDFLIASKGMERAVSLVKRISAKQIEKSLAEEVVEDQKVLDIVKLLKKNPQNKDIILQVLEMDMDIIRLLKILQTQLKGKQPGILPNNQNTIYF